MTDPAAEPSQNALPPAVGDSGFARGYAGRPDAVDEMIDADGSLRPHWRTFISLLDELGPDELLCRWDQARSLIHENGITHNVYGDPHGLDRPWSLDFIPLLLAAEEWDRVSAGLSQRARLFDRLLADLYGPADVISSGLLPPELVYANPGFLRPCHGMKPPSGRWLHLYAADLVRTRGGGFEVLSDRTQAPSGAGYTLENRIVLSRVLPSVFRRCNVRRLAPFFSTLRNSLAELAPSHRPNPRVVLLTPGPYNETYFEHVYLSRYLGYTLVQGNDLTVRDARVFLKTLSGLHPVDVILRRVDDDFCDPLELYPNSFLGVPGLIQAAREGNVAIANALGSGVLQGPGFLPFLPSLCRRLLGEELKLPSVQTWWCGDPSSRAFVLDQLPNLVLKPALPTTGTDPVFGRDLSSGELEELAARVRAKPHEYVAQEQSMACTAPALGDEGISPRRFAVRAHLAIQGDGYAVMPGGLTRIPWSSESLIVSMQKGGGSKDTWILADQPVQEATLLASSLQPVALSRGGGDLPSRIADDLFWLGRYVQRAESTVRIARSALGRLIDVSGIEARVAVRALTRALGGVNGGESPDRDLIQAFLGPPESFGLRSTAASIHRLARLLRDRISVDAWRILQGIEREVVRFEVDPGDPCSGVLDLLDGLVASFSAFAGMSIDSMTRGQGWRFLDLGHRLERAICVVRLLRDTLVDTAEEEGPLLEAVLEICDSSITYRRRYLTRLEAHALADLLLADETNPRAVAYQAVEIHRHLDALPHESNHPQQHADRQRALRLRSAVQLANLTTACEASGGKRPGLEALLREILCELAGVSDAIASLYFTHAVVHRGLRTRMQEPGA
ncbi:MAG TPA: circularly permuted type 2 ATP-grasp protein [Planctomycetota bacterium]|nr:circularly permuted type 2 ATP-grasp protein [Planctomycetota bacterium]